MTAHPLWHVRDKMAKLIHQRSGHVENHSGSGGCFEAADEIIGMLPADLVKARADLEDLEERAGLILAERDAIAGERDRLRAVLEKAVGRRFPVLDGGPGCPSSVPWAALHHHEGQALKNHEQTLERLAERGGLSPCEMVAVLEGRRWTRMTQTEAVERMVELTDAALRSLAASPGKETGR